MRFDPELADIRFGCGLSPVIAPPASMSDMLSRLAGPDIAATRHPIEGFDAYRKHVKTFHLLRRREKKASESDRKAARKQFNDAKRNLRQQSMTGLGQSLLRRALTMDGFRERLVTFWADHFTAAGRPVALRYAQMAYIEDAIRPHISGDFRQMLRAATTHPLMLTYLDQNVSVGPNSKAAQKARKPKGLNENLARELMELHTLGVEGPYTQTDVRQLAQLLAGLTFSWKRGFSFNLGWSEPGPDTILGKTLWWLWQGRY